MESQSARQANGGAVRKVSPEFCASETWDCAAGNVGDERLESCAVGNISDICWQTRDLLGLIGSTWIRDACGPQEWFETRLARGSTCSNVKHGPTWGATCLGPQRGEPVGIDATVLCLDTGPGMISMRGKDIDRNDCSVLRTMHNATVEFFHGQISVGGFFLHVKPSGWFSTRSRSPEGAEGWHQQYEVQGAMEDGTVLAERRSFLLDLRCEKHQSMCLCGSTHTPSTSEPKIHFAVRTG